MDREQESRRQTLGKSEIRSRAVGPAVVAARLWPRFRRIDRRGSLTMEMMRYSTQARTACSARCMRRSRSEHVPRRWPATTATIDSSDCRFTGGQELCGAGIRVRPSCAGPMLAQDPSRLTALSTSRTISGSPPD